MPDIETEEPIELSIWEPIPEDADKPVGGRRLRKTRDRTYQEVYDELEARLKVLSDEEVFEKPICFEYCYAGWYPSYRKNNETIPTNELHWVACYAVTGGSEGHYVHVDLILDDPDATSTLTMKRIVKPLALIKTFMGMKHARHIAGLCADILDA